MSKKQRVGGPAEFFSPDRIAGGQPPLIIRFFKIIGEAVCRAGEFPVSVPPVVRAAMWLLLAIMVPVLLFPGSWLYPQDAPGIHPILISQGGALLNKLVPSDLPHMPLLSVACLWLQNSTIYELQTLWFLISIIICVLGYSCGAMLSGRPAGVAASTALFAGQAWTASFFDLEQRFYCLILLLVANALALTKLSSRVRRLVEGGAIGISFLSRSVLCLFPFVLAMFEFKNAKKYGLKKLSFRIFLTLAVPFLFLLPWIRFNLVTADRFALFDGRAAWNVVTGAMGIVSTMEGDYHKLAGIDRDKSEVLSAAKLILNDPFIYGAGVVKRIGFVFSIYPLTLLCWAVLTAVMWKRPDFRRVNLLGIYFMALHTAFSVEERYLAAIVPLLAAVVVISVFALAGERANDAARKEGTFLFAVGAVPPVLLCLFCVLLLLRHPGKIPQADVRRALAAALAGHPGNSWLLSEQGRSRLLNGDYAGAYDSLGKAVILSPGDMSAKIDLAVAALLKNQKNNRPAAGADLITKMLFPGKEWPFPPTGKEYILKALYEIDKGREQEAQKSIRQALKIRRNSLYFKLKSDIIDEEKLRSFDNAIAGRFLLELAAYFPAGKKEKLCSKFIFMYEEGKLSRQAAYLWCDNMLWQMRAGWKEVSFTQRDYMQPVAKPGTASAVDNKNRDDIRNIISALSRARKEHKRVILQLGGEWCDWCKRMDDVFKHDRGIAAFLDRKYILVKISVGQNDPPPPAVAMYPRLNSCPYLYVLGCDGAMLISKSTESFEIGEGYDRDEIMSFLRAWAPDSPPGL